MASVPPVETERALIGLVGTEPWLTLAPEIIAGTFSPEIASVADVDLAVEGSCLRLTPSGPSPSVTVRAPDGDILHVMSEPGGALSVQLSRSGSFEGVDAPSLDLPARGVAAVRLPDLADEGTWQARLMLPASGPSLVCLSSPQA